MIDPLPMGPSTSLRNCTPAGPVGRWNRGRPTGKAGIGARMSKLRPGGPNTIRPNRSLLREEVEERVVELLGMTDVASVGSAGEHHQLALGDGLVGALA